MAEQRLFGEVLSSRRKRLNLSIDRVVSDTKLQRRIIEAFERSDFAALPPKGYATATLASYASYLGLNPDSVVRLFEAQLREYEYQKNQPPQRSSGAYGSRPRGSSRPSSSSYQPSTRPRSSQAYAQQERSYQSQDVRGYDGRSRTARQTSQHAYDQGYSAQPYTQRNSSSYATRRDPYQNSREQRSGTHRSSNGSYNANDTYGRPSQSRDRSNNQEYQRSSFSQTSYGQQRSQTTRSQRNNRDTQSDRIHAGRISQANGYEGGSGADSNRYGFRTSTRSNSERINRSLQQSNAFSGLNGILAGFEDFFRQSRMSALVVVGLIVVLLLVIIVLAIGSCSGGSSDSENKTIPVTEIGSTTQSQTEVQTDTDSSGETSQETTTQTAISQTPIQVTPTIDVNALPAGSTFAFAVSADSTTYPWIEVSIDGIAQYAAQAAPGEVQTFTMGTTATITLSDASDVTITVNDVQVQPSIDEAGMATLTLNCVVDETQQDVGEDASEGEIVEEPVTDEVPTE